MLTELKQVMSYLRSIGADAYLSSGCVRACRVVRDARGVLVDAWSELRNVNEARRWAQAGAL